MAAMDAPETTARAWFSTEIVLMSLVGITSLFLCRVWSMRAGAVARIKAPAAELGRQSDPDVLARSYAITHQHTLTSTSRKTESTNFQGRTTRDKDPWLVASCSQGTVAGPGDGGLGRNG